jgi:hypothetical protein
VALTYCTLTGVWKVPAGDGPDVGTDPDLLPVNGDVSVNYMIETGGVFRAIGESPSVGLPVVPVPGRLVSGVLKDLQGNTGVRVLANTGLEVDGDLWATVSFNKCSITLPNNSVVPVTIKSFDFQLPTTDTAVDLIEVTPLTGVNAAGLLQGPRGYTPFFVPVPATDPQEYEQWDSNGEISGSDPIVLSVFEALGTPVTKTSAYTLQPGDNIIGDTSGGSFTLSLVENPADPRPILVKRYGDNPLTVQKLGGDVINLAESSMQLLADGQSAWYIYEPTNHRYWVIANGTPLAALVDMFVSQGQSAYIPQILGADETTVAKFTGTTSAANYWEFKNSAAAAGLIELIAAGADTNIAAYIESKGPSGAIILYNTTVGDAAYTRYYQDTWFTSFKMEGSSAAIYLYLEPKAGPVVISSTTPTLRGEKPGGGGHLTLTSETGIVDLASVLQVNAASGNSPTLRSGAGTPEGVVTAPVGSLYMRNDGAAGTCLYVKESGTGNSGWIAK